MSENGLTIRDWMGKLESDLREWTRKIEIDLQRLDDKWQKSTDDIKNTIKAEVSDLKSEAIAELRRRIDDGYRTLSLFEIRLRDAENSARDLNTGKNTVGWIISTAIGAGGLAIAAIGLLAGYLSAKHLL